MKKVLVLIVSFFFVSNSFAEPSCEEYISMLDRCEKAESARDIEDFICIEAGSSEYKLYQIILDKKMEDIDKNARDTLGKLYDKKDYYFGENQKKHFIYGLDDIEATFGNVPKGYYYNKYKHICEGPNYDESALSKMVDCLGEIGNQAVPEFVEGTFYKNNCMKMVETKLEIYKQTAIDIMKLNKNEVRNDNKSKYREVIRIMRDTLSKIILYNTNYLEKIRDKWNVKTPDVYY